MPNALAQVFSRSLRHQTTRRRRPSDSFTIDRLEVRLLPTAVVTFTGAALTITGDTGPNNITVERVGTQLHVDANGGSIRVLGTDVPEFFFSLGGAFNLAAKFGDGGNILELAGGLSLRSANISMGDGGAIVDVSDTTLSGKLTIVTGSATIVDIKTTSVTGTTLIETGASTILDINDSRFAGATTITTDGGSSILDIFGTTSRTRFGGKLSIKTSAESDIVALGKIDCRALSIDSGGDDDLLSLEDVLVNGAVSVKAGSGHDSLAVLGVIQSGSGAVLLDVGADDDELGIAGCSFSGATTVNLGNDDVANSLDIEDSSFNAFTLNSRATGDSIAIEQDLGRPGQTTFAKAARFNLGAATNIMAISTPDPATKTLFLSSVSFSSLPPGTDIFVDATNTSFARLPKLKNVAII